MRLILLLFCLLFLPRYAAAQEAFPSYENYFFEFTVIINDVRLTESQSITPCYPVMAKFGHPDSRVTKVRMRYPYNHNMFYDYPVDGKIHIELHENFMKQNEYSLSDFIAMDNEGFEYGMITLTFVPPQNDEAAQDVQSNTCAALTS